MYSCKAVKNILTFLTFGEKPYFPVIPGNYQYFPGITSISRRPGKYEYFPLFCQPCQSLSQDTSLAVNMKHPSKEFRSQILTLTGPKNKKKFDFVNSIAPDEAACDELPQLPCLPSSL